MDITVATWNTEWRTPASGAGPRIAATLAAPGFDFIVVTEGVRELLPEQGYTVDAGADWGYPLKPSRRKVIVWSRYPLTEDFVGVEGATLGRLAVATAIGEDGPIRIIGVCIPWRDAHVHTGRGNAHSWSEHLDYLDHLERILPALGNDIPTVIAGDFNQRIPRKGQPQTVADRLREVLADWTIHTCGELPNGPHIDHIATNQHIGLQAVSDWSASDHLGRLSDHAGVACRLVSVGCPRQPTGPVPLLGNPLPQSEPLGNSQQKLSGTPALDHDGHEIETAGALIPELRAEIESILRASGDGLSHGATFRLHEQGLRVDEIADRRGVSLGATRNFLRSLDALLSGTLPTSTSAALTNSYVYRELLNHARSDELDRYVDAQLRRLKSINPEVSFAPLRTRTHQYRVGERKHQ
ncbi:endonuclease/exonuclease/phosphatase family protein [Mycolicibacterium sediminis]|uniref:Endonuclease/exonuclease/phosphatase domain-containing protein n=1 Tax=Mycolicibacterium sediminis TaxID=1286180 RepID=A0A7I7QQM6_9MYCO|nr:endonuclease/exonuclease/phosphatase family protein [Mycolicibacterium sediminis]BBY28146.1 hypothetical protein MSEDJ_22420 [Mycolicibacterium sediminis]